MSKILIIAEKPSVATDLARVLAKAPGMSKFNKDTKGTFFENDQAIITSAIGHLVELKMPTTANGKKLPWSFNVLPAIPDEFELQPIEKSEDRLKLVLKLAKRKDVSSLVNACDAGREGELIFQYIIKIGNIQKPVKRLWMQSMTPQAILKAWGQLREGSSMQALADAAICRSESDWLVGLNGTRALTCFRSRNGGFNVTTAGRVQTPTLAILAERERKIRDFVATPYFEVHAEFGVQAGNYPGKWFDQTFRKDAENEVAKAERLFDATSAQSIVDRCHGKPGRVTEERKPAKQAAPQLFDLTSLQREASSRFGYSARRTLQLAQACYEKYKVLTYPRTDSKYLPEDYVGNVYGVCEQICDKLPEMAPHAKELISKKMITPNKRIFNNAKVSDHFAIIPTGTFAKLDPEAEKIFLLVVKRFLAVFFPPAVFEVTKRITYIDHPQFSDAFRTDGRILVEAGWRAVYGQKPGLASGKEDLCIVAKDEKATTDHIEVRADETKPPARYNEATLLSAMEGAGKLVEDEELREAMSERGLGTPATRAAIIEGLIAQKYIARDGRDLHVTGKGLSMIDTLNEIGIDELTSPEMTGEWEYKLKLMEQGKLSRNAFMHEITDFTKRIVGRTKEYADSLKNREFSPLNAPCPVCGETPLRQTDSTYECQNQSCSFRFNKFIAGREITPDEAIQLVTRRFVGPLIGFRSRFNKPFDAGLEFDEKFKLKFVFESAEDEPESVELTEQMIIGQVTVNDQAPTPVYELEKNYFVPGITTKNDPKGIRIGKVILQREISSAEALDLLSNGKTKLLQGFVSKKTRRKFGAFLTFDAKSGKIGFEFEPRPAKAPAKKAAKKAANTDE